MSAVFFAAILLAALLAFYLGRSRAYGLADPAGKIAHLHSLPGYHGAYSALAVALPALLVLLWARRVARGWLWNIPLPP